MVDELQLLRQVFSNEELPDVLAWDALNERLSTAYKSEHEHSDRLPRRDRQMPRVRRRLVVTMAIAAVLIAALVITVNGLGSQTVASASPFRLAALVKIPGFEASTHSVQFANHATCPTSNDCFLVARFMNAPTASVANNVYRSTDGGGTWQILALPTGIYADTAFSCTSKVQCSVGAGRFVGLDAGDKPIMDPVLLNTSNGGISWTIRSIPAPQLGHFENLFSPAITQLNCPSSKMCNVMLEANFGGLGYSTAVDNVFLHTDNGGLSWSSVMLPDQPAPESGGGFVNSPSSASMSCPSSEVCVASALLSPTGSTTSIVWRTIDGGTTWSVGSLPKSFTSAGPLSCPDSLHCWIVAGSYGNGSNSQLLESTDGGRSWIVRSPQGLPTTINWGSVSCPTDEDCWLAGQTVGASSESVVYFSNDGGQTWTNVLLPMVVGTESAPLKGIDEIDCNTSLTCVVLGIPAGVSENGVNEAILTNVAPNT